VVIRRIHAAGAGEGAVVRRHDLRHDSRETNYRFWRWEPGKGAAKPIPAVKASLAHLLEGHTLQSSWKVHGDRKENAHISVAIRGDGTPRSNRRPFLSNPRMRQQVATCHAPDVGAV
jgi:hypothetical protein